MARGEDPFRRRRGRRARPPDRCSGCCRSWRGPRADFVVVNGENAAGGLGITPKIADELFAAGVDVITLGQPRLPSQARSTRTWTRTSAIVRPANYLATQPGRGVVRRRARRRAPGGGEPQRQRLPARGARRVPRGRRDPRASCAARSTTCSSTCTPRRPARRSRWAGTSTAASRPWSAPTRTSRPPTHACCPAGPPTSPTSGMTGPRGGVIGVRKEQAIESLRTHMSVALRDLRGRPVAQRCT